MSFPVRLAAVSKDHLTDTNTVLIKLFKPKSKAPIQLPIEEDEPLQSNPSSGAEAPSASELQKSDTHSLKFDLALARGSVAIEVISYTLIPFAPSGGLFTIATMFGSFGSGFAPALQSVALSLYTAQGGKESGRLFGALSVVQALCSQILGPALFGTTFMYTAGTFPTAIFFVAAFFVSVSLVTLSFVRLPQAERGDVEGRAVSPGAEDSEDPLADSDIPRIVVDHVPSKSSSPSSPVPV